jgi:ribosomal protein S18 acetylase RimI-like enzyme
MAIRLATSNDLSALQEIAVKAYEPYVARMGQEPAPMRPDFARHIAEDTVFVWDEGCVKGYAVIVIDGDEPLLDNIAADPVAQGQRVGSKLLEHVEAYLRAEGFGAYTLYTNVHMTENIAWYTRAGFIETGRGAQDGFERVFFRKLL